MDTHRLRRLWQHTTEVVLQAKIEEALSLLSMQVDPIKQAKLWTKELWTSLRSWQVVITSHSLLNTRSKEVQAQQTTKVLSWSNLSMDALKMATSSLTLTSQPRETDKRRQERTVALSIRALSRSCPLRKTCISSNRSRTLQVPTRAC